MESIPPVLLRLCMIVSFGMMLIHFNSSCLGCRSIAHTCDCNQSTKPRHDKIVLRLSMYNLYISWNIPCHPIVIRHQKRCEISHQNLQIPIINWRYVWCNKPWKKTPRWWRNYRWIPNCRAVLHDVAWSAFRWWRMSLYVILSHIVSHIEGS